MTEFMINKEKAVAVSGHRFLQSDFDLELLEKVFIELINKGYDTFLIGMAVGFDTECFRVLEKLRERSDIEIIACIPCLKQSLKFSAYQKIEYERMIKSADQKIVLQDEYDNYCMLRRNDFMVDNASVLVTYLRKNTGGTAYTVKKATQKNLHVIKI
ncbi:MAG: DUF1273 family protein [Clostridia bacterium]|nr:DUF1273 family protein [Clostridia bacterium]